MISSNSEFLDYSITSSRLYKITVIHLLHLFLHYYVDLSENSLDFEFIIIDFMRNTSSSFLQESIITK